MRKALSLLTLALLSLHANAQSPGETRLNADVRNVFTRVDRAWAAYQLKATSALYDVGDVVTAANAPATLADLFNPYRLQPASRDDRSFSLAQASGADVTVCVSAVVKSADELTGFMTGMRQSGAQVAAADCSPGALNGSIAFPAQVFSRKVVQAKRAAEIIAKDAAERAAQAAVADTITFSLPSGKLLDFSVLQGQTSEVKTAVLENTAGEVWGATVEILDGPFTASPVGCDAVAPTGTCALSVDFRPTAVGKVTGHVRITTSTGKSLVLRLAGTGLTP